MQFQQDWPKDKKNYSSFHFLAENLEKFRSTELNGAALEGSTTVLCRSPLGCTSMESCQLSDLKYAIFSSTGCQTNYLPRSKLSEQRGLIAPQKGPNCNFSSPEFDKSYGIRKLSISNG